MRKLDVLLFFLVVCPALLNAQQAPNPKIYALVVGVASFEDKDVPPLTLPGKDAQTFYHLLRSNNCGLIPEENIRLLTDTAATRSNILHALSDLTRSMTPEDMFLFYYSGHGKVGEIDKEGYFLGYDAKMDNLEGTALSMNEINRKIQHCPAKLKVCYIDACHAGLFIEENVKGPSSNSAIVESFMQDIKDAPAGNITLMSSNADQRSRENPKLGNSIFTYFLIEGLKGRADKETHGGAGNNDGLVSAPELYAYVSKHVTEVAGNLQTVIPAGHFDASFILSVADTSQSLTRTLSKIKFPDRTETQPHQQAPPKIPPDENLSPGYYFTNGYCYGVVGFVNGCAQPVTVVMAYERGRVAISPFSIPPGGNRSTERIVVGLASASQDCRDKFINYTFGLTKQDGSGNTLYATVLISAESCKRKWTLLSDDNLVWSKKQLW